MGTEEGKDPNQAYDEELARGSKAPEPPEGAAWGGDLNPVRETPTPFGSLNDGGTGGAR